MKRVIRRQITLSKDTDALLQKFAQEGETTASEVVNDALWSMFTSIRGGTLVDSFMIDGFGRYRTMATVTLPGRQGDTSDVPNDYTTSGELKCPPRRTAPR